MPILYRVGRMSVKPGSLTVNGLTLLVNQSGSLPEMESEGEVNEATSTAWYYDAVAQRLIVEGVPLVIAVVPVALDQHWRSSLTRSRLAMPWISESSCEMRRRGSRAKRRSISSRYTASWRRRAS